MDNATLLQPLNEILAQAQVLLNLANAEEWEEMEVQAVKYQQHVVFLNDDAYLKAIAEANAVGEAKALIVEIQELNDELDSRANDTRDKIASELRHMIQSDKAMNAYGR